MSRVVTKAVGTLLASTAVVVVTGAVLTGRVVRAERQAILPPVLRLRPDGQPAIVVFGAQTLPTGPSDELIARLDHARALFERGLASTIVVSGGTSVNSEGHTLDETADMTVWLVDHGVPAEAIAIGRPGDNTRQTVATMGRLTREQGLQPWLAVSSPFHARRILDEAKRVGIDVVVSGPGDSPETLTPRVRRFQLSMEVLATAYYATPPTLTARTRTPLQSLRRRFAEYLIRDEE